MLVFVVVLACVVVLVCVVVADVDLCVRGSAPSCGLYLALSTECSSFFLFLPVMFSLLP